MKTRDRGKSPTYTWTGRSASWRRSARKFHSSFSTKASTADHGADRKVDLLTRNVAKAVIIRTASSSWQSIETGGDPNHALPWVPSLISWLAKIPEDALQELDCEIGCWR